MKRVKLTIDGKTYGGTLLMSSENRRSLAVALDDPLIPVPGGSMYGGLALLRDGDDGPYREITCGAVVTVEYDAPATPTAPEAAPAPGDVPSMPDAKQLAAIITASALASLGQVELRDPKTGEVIDPQAIARAIGNNAAMAVAVECEPAD